MKSRTPGCSGKALQDGRDRADEVSRTINTADQLLGKLSKEFVLRRTAQVLENYLPPKRELSQTSSYEVLTGRRIRRVCRSLHSSAKRIWADPEYRFHERSDTW